MKTILISIVEDIADVRTGLERIINANPSLCCVSAYASAEDALDGLPKLQPDIVIMDVNLPAINGIDCLRRMKRLCPDMRFIMFTINEDSDQVFEALSAGASGYLLKNTPHSEIPTALKELYEGGAPMSAGIAKKIITALHRQASSEPEHFALSLRETEILHFLSKGFLYKEIGQRLGISTGTVRQHIHHIYEKLHVQNRTEALNKFFGRPGV